MVNNDHIHECFRCSTPCTEDLCDECAAIEQFDVLFAPCSEEEDVPDEWYEEWDEYVKEYE
jgi:hypothetical protein